MPPLYRSPGKKGFRRTRHDPELVERLVCVDISPSQTKDISGFQNFIAAMKAVDIPKVIPSDGSKKKAKFYVVHLREHVKK